jgi:folate-binding protein YgfZ
VANLETSEIRHLSAADGAAFEADYVAVTKAAGVRVLDDRVVVRVVGDDRVSFFHGMCSADVKGAKPNDVLAALILTEHAHVIADLFIWVTDDALLLDIDADAWTRTRAHLERLLVADDVEFEDGSEFSVIDIEGPKALDAARNLSSINEKTGGDNAGALAEWRSVSAGDLRIANMARVGGPAVSIVAPRAEVDSIIGKVLESIADSRRIDLAVLETIRIENGIARIGVETGDKTIALEARLNRAISFNKGCYLGQETVERATSRGGLKKRMFGIKFNGRAPSVGASLSLGDKEVGRVSSAIQSPRFGAIGLAILHHSAWQPGTELKVDNNGTAVVAELPFSQD